MLLAMETRDRIQAALSASYSRLRRAGITLVIDHVLAQPLEQCIDTDTVTQILVQALSRENCTREIERHILPGLTRVHAALREAGERVGDAVPDDARASLEALVRNPKGPRFAWLAGALDRDKLRTLLAPALQEMLVSFASRVPFATQGDKADRADRGGPSAVGAAAGLLSRVGRGTGERLLNLGKSVADGFGVDIETRLREAARDYSQTATVGLQRAIAARLATPEAEALVSGLAQSVLDHVLRTPMDTILNDLDRLPLADAIRLAPPILAHDLARPLWQAIVRAEVQAVLSLEGPRSLRTLLEEAGLYEPVRTLLVERGDTLLGPLFASEAFGAWLDEVLAGS